MPPPCPTCGRETDPASGGCGSCGSTVTEAPMGVAPGTADLQEIPVPTPRTSPHTSPMSLEQAVPGLERIGRYRVLGKVGTGGMGVVYKALDEELNRTLALKVMVAGEHASETTLARFQREARAAARLSHPHIVHVYDVGSVPTPTGGTVYYFAMEYVEGRPLDAIVRERRPTPKEAAVIARDTALALEYAHGQGVVHRDVKPGNLLIDRAGKAHLVDFGIAKAALDDADVTRTGEIIGTANYMPPEQVSGSMKAVDAKSDVYSLGAVLYEMLTGRPPFQGESVIKIFRQIEERDPRAPSRLAPGIPRDLETICLKAMAREKHRRYPRAAELAADLDRFLSGRPVEARPEGPAARAVRWTRRHPTVAVSVLLIGVFAGIMASTWRPGPAPPPPPPPTPDPMGRLNAAKVHFSEAEDRVETARRTRRPEDRRRRREFFERALTAVGEAIRIYPEYAEAYQLRGIIREELNQPARALADFDEAVGLNATLAESYFRRATIRMALIAEKSFRGTNLLLDLDLAAAFPTDYGLIKADIEALRRLQMKTEKALIAEVRCALLFRESADLADLIARAVAANPTFADAYVVRADVKMREADAVRRHDPARAKVLMGEALEDAGTALSYDPNLEDAFRVRARAAIRLEMPLDAERDLEELAALAPEEPQTHLDKALVLMTEPGALRWHPAIAEALQKAVLLDPANLRARFLSSMWALMTDRIKGKPDAIRACRDEFTEILAKDPLIPDAHSLRLICDHSLLDEKAFEEHFEAFRKARTDLSDDARTQLLVLVRARAEDLRQLPHGEIVTALFEGRRKISEGDRPGARDRLEAAVQLLADPAATAREGIAPADARLLRSEARYHLAIIAALAGDADGALSELGRALDARPTLADRAAASLDLVPLRSHPDFEKLLKEARLRHP